MLCASVPGAARFRLRTPVVARGGHRRLGAMDAVAFVATHWVAPASLPEERDSVKRFESGVPGTIDQPVVFAR